MQSLLRPVIIGKRKQKNRPTIRFEFGAIEEFIKKHRRSGEEEERIILNSPTEADNIENLRLLKPAETAKILGVSRSTIYKMASTGILPCVSWNVENNGSDS
jgi:hypothetical protein